MLRAIVLNRKNHDERVLALLTGAVAEALKEIDPEADVVTAKQDYQARSERCEGFTMWCALVGGGADREGNPTYNLYVVPDLTIGKATAEIIQAAIQTGRKVVYTSDGKTFQRVTGFKLANKGVSWIDYAQLRLGE